MFNIIFCDDNSQYLASLKAYVQKECQKVVPKEQGYMIGPAFGSGEEVLQYIKNNHIDVLLLDIDMPYMSGFDVARRICKEYPHVKIVFMSAYDNFVYSSFEFYPFAYLRKSHIAHELPGVIKRIVDKMNEPNRQIKIETNSGPKMVDINSVVYVESNRNYYTIHLLQGKKYVCRGTLISFEDEVRDFDFFRIHSAFLVNLEHVERILENGFVLVKNVTLPIAQKRAKDFRKVYMDYVRRCFNT